MARAKKDKLEEIITEVKNDALEQALSATGMTEVGVKYFANEIKKIENLKDSACLSDVIKKLNELIELQK